MAKRGPGTERGRTAVRHNALKHGLRSDAPVLPGESFEDWRLHLDGIVESLEPQGHLENVLAERAASLLWRLRRAQRFEVAAISGFQARAEDDLRLAAAYAERTLSKGIVPNVSVEEVEESQQRRLLPDERDLDKIMRYEAHLHRQFLQTLHELEALQLRRRGERSPLARLDISGPPVA